MKTKEVSRVPSLVPEKKCPRSLFRIPILFMFMHVFYKDNCQPAIPMVLQR